MKLNKKKNNCKNINDSNKCNVPADIARGK